MIKGIGAGGSTLRSLRMGGEALDQLPGEKDDDDDQFEAYVCFF